MICRIQNSYIQQNFCLDITSSTSKIPMITSATCLLAASVVSSIDNYNDRFLIFFLMLSTEAL